MHSQYERSCSGHLSFNSVRTATVHAVTASPSVRHALGLPWFLSLHAMYASFTFLHWRLMCFDEDINRALVGRESPPSAPRVASFSFAMPMLLLMTLQLAVFDYFIQNVRAGQRGWGGRETCWDSVLATTSGDRGPSMVDGRCSTVHGRAHGGGAAGPDGLGRAGVGASRGAGGTYPGRSGRRPPWCP